MTLFLVAVVMGAAVAAWVVIPLLLRRRAMLSDASPASLVDVEARRRVALASLKEVEYDRVSGKLDDEDYRQLRAQLEREALAAIDAAENAGGDLAAGGAGTGEAGAHACGFVNPAGSRFCAGCGGRLA